MPSVLPAQSTSAPLSGIALDSSGVVASRTTNNDSSQYGFPSLPPGTYPPAGENPGFRRTSVNEVLLEAGGRTSLDITLELGQTTEIIGALPENFFRANPQFASARLFSNLSSSTYHSLQVDYIERPRSLQIQWNYTFAKALGDEDGDANGALLLSNPGPGVLGAMNQRAIFGPGYFHFDANVIKRVQITGRINF